MPIKPQAEWQEICERSVGAVLNGKKGLIILEDDLVRIGALFDAAQKELKAELEAERRHRIAAQKALMFWLPMVPCEPEEISKRVGDDAMLLIGYEGEEEPPAEALGWLSLDHTRRYGYLRDRPLDAINQGGVFAGQTPENVVLNGEDLDAALDDATHSLKSSDSSAEAERWISTSDRLPEKYDRVLMLKDCGKGSLCSQSVGYYYDGLWAFDLGKAVAECGYRITHWRPLPKPPAPGSNNGESND